MNSPQRPPHLAPHLAPALGADERDMTVLTLAMEKAASSRARRRLPAPMAVEAIPPPPLMPRRETPGALGLKEVVVRSRADIRSDPDTIPPIRPTSLAPEALAEIPWGSFLRLLHLPDSEAGFMSAARKSKATEDMADAPWSTFLDALVARPQAPAVLAVPGGPVRFDTGEIDAVVARFGEWE